MQPAAAAALPQTSVLQVCLSAVCRQQILERCLKRLEWDKVQTREAKAAADAKEAERLAMQAIDWCALVKLRQHDPTRSPA